MKDEVSMSLPKLNKLGTRIWELVEDWHFEFSCGMINVPAGTRTNGANIPRWLWWLLGDGTDMAHLVAGLVHDWCYESGVFTRAEADMIYRELLIQLGVSRKQAYTEWISLRLFGARHYNEKGSWDDNV